MRTLGYFFGTSRVGLPEKITNTFHDLYQENYEVYILIKYEAAHYYILNVSFGEFISYFGP
jgi:hypothetical protein